MSSQASCGMCKVIGALVAIGAINWGLVGAFHLDLVEKFLGAMTGPARIVYVLIGVAGLMKVGWLLQLCPCQKSGGGCGPSKS